MTKKEIKMQIDGVERFMGLEPRSRVLDLGCGSGRRTIELARRGHRVLGMDPDAGALADARALAQGEKLNIHFMKADTRGVPYRSEIDAVVSLEGAFGRLPSDRDDQSCLESARKALKPGGLLLIDTLNKERLMRGFAPSETGFDFERGRLDNRRVYALTELKTQLERAGLVYRRSWGGFDGCAYGMDSARMIVLAERPRDERGFARRAGADNNFPTAIRIKGRRKK